MDRIDIFHPSSPNKRFFTHEELACKATGNVKLATGFADELAMLRASFGEGMTVTSCCRSAEHNRNEDGHPRSLHVWDEPAHPVDGTCAIDIWARDVYYASRLVKIAQKQGWSVGIRKGLVHLDLRQLAGLPKMAVFGY